MTIAHSARKIIKTQRFIFRALPALLVSAFVLNACAGAVPVTVNDSSASNEEIAKLKHDATTADNRITELEEASRVAGVAKTTADNDITRLKNEAVQAGIAKTSADSEIKILKGQLATAIGERGTANGRITTLEGELSTATGALSTASDRITELEGQLSTAIRERDAETGDKTTANLRITELEGELSTAIGERDTARGKVTDLQGQLSTAEGERDTANGKVTTLQGQLSTVTGERDTANRKVTELEGELSTATTDKNTADAEVIRLTEALRLAEEARLQELRDNHSVIEFADWAGTAEAPKTTVINSAGTGTSPLLNGAASVGNGNYDRNFIQGLPIVAGQGFDFTGTAFADATVVGDVLLLADNSPSGVAFSRVSGTGVTRAVKFYTGLLPTTNLGAPITNINTDVIWDAKIMLVAFSNQYSNLDFKMRVTFDGSEGTINSGTLSGGVFTEELINAPYTSTSGDTGSHPFNIQGRFGSDGLLHGRVILNAGLGGLLTGLIGADGAVGAFTGLTLNGIGPYAGGFVAYPTDPRIAELEEELRLANEELYTLRPASYSKWVAAVNPDAKPDLTSPQSQFLQGKDGTLDTTGTTHCADSDSDSGCEVAGSRTAPTVISLNLKTQTFDGRPINGDINDGYAIFGGYIGETEYYYAGILESTDLGAPLTGNAGTSVQWNGVITAQLDFVLTITFDADGGRLDAFGDANFDALVRFQNARFDTGGVITGTVIFQHFTDRDPTKPIDTATDGDPQTGDFALSGLIGQEGLVAVAIGANFLYGFVAHPDITFNPAVIRSDWTRNIGDIRQAFTSVPRNQFLYSGFDTTGVYANSDGTGTVTAEYLDFRRATFNGSPLSTDGTGHIRFFSGYNGDTRHYYAGLGGDLGATLPVWETGRPTSAIWPGQFSVLQGGNVPVDEDLTLEVDFENRRLTAFVPVGTNHYLLDAGFNADDDGFFAGTVNFGAFTDTTNRTSTNTLTSGVLTGLIGAEGAVGVFVSGSTTDNGRTITGGAGDDGFAGGFVVIPRVIYADWGGTAEAPKRTVKNADIYSNEELLNGVAGVDNGPDFQNYNFIQGLAIVEGQGFDFAGTDFASESVLGDVLLLGADNPSGVAFSIVYRTGVTEIKGYAGLLPGTNLGAPITARNTSAIWNAKIVVTNEFFGDQFILNSSFKMQVIFNISQGTINSGTLSNQEFTPDFIRVKSPENGRGSHSSGGATIQGRFDSDGLLYGTVSLGTNDGTLTGLIGVNGAVGAFGGAVGGGFVARPDIAFNPDVRGSDWVRKVGEFQIPFTSIPKNQFLTSERREFLQTRGVWANSDGTGYITAAGLNLSTATFGGSPLGGDDLVIISFFSGYNGGTRHYYSGLFTDRMFSNVNLGLPLPVWQSGQPASAEWKGQFSVLQGANARANADLTLEVNFENRRLTAFVPVGTNHYLLDAGFNADDDGFFAGTVNFGAFTDTTNRTSTNTLTPGVLTGIIGVEGAGGVFVSGSSVDNGRTITGGEGENGFAGGFVACPYNDANNECQ